MHITSEAMLGLTFSKEVSKYIYLMCVVTGYRELQDENCLLLHTLKPDAARLQRSEVHYGLNFEVWMAYLEPARLIHHHVQTCS